jgi:hypothetical protein
METHQANHDILHKHKPLQMPDLQKEESNLSALGF